MPSSTNSKLCYCCHKNPPPTPSELGLTQAEADATVAALLQHAYHLPQHNWAQDWWQYMTNNHPVFGVGCHHVWHPLDWKIRLVTLLGSILMGLAITCLIYVAFVFSRQDYDQQYYQVKTNATRTGLQQDLDDNVSTLTVTSGNIVLWTVGAFLHGLYDNCIWALAAGTCCDCCRSKDTVRQGSLQRAERFKSTRTFLVLFSVVVVVAITFLAISLQMALSSEDDGTEIVLVDTTTTSNENTPTLQTEQLFQIKTDNANDYEFIIAYLIELALNYFGYYPLIGTVLFSGVLSCGRGQLLGGRPWEIKDEELEAAERGRHNNHHQHNPNNRSSVPPRTSNNNRKSSTTSTKKNTAPRNKSANAKNASPGRTKK